MEQTQYRDHQIKISGKNSDIIKASIGGVWHQYPTLEAAHAAIDAEFPTADNTAGQVETLIEAINGNSADYDLAQIVAELNAAGIELTEFDPQHEDGTYYQQHEQQVWTILAAHDHS